MVVEDLFDTGASMMRLDKKLREFGAKNIEYAIVFHKRNPKNLKHNFMGKYSGFTIPDEFVMGYGLDYDDAFREMKDLVVVNQKEIKNYKPEWK